MCRLILCVWELIHIYMELQNHYSIVTIHTPEDKAMSWHKVYEISAYTKQARVHGRKQTPLMNNKSQHILPTKSWKKVFYGAL